MKKYILLFLIFIPINLVLGQSVDDLRQCIEDNYGINPDKAIVCLKAIAKKHKQKKDWEEYVWTSAETADNYQYKGDFDSLKIILDQTITFAKKYNTPLNSEVYSFIWNLYGIYHNHRSDFNTAINFFKKSLAIDTLQREVYLENVAAKYINIAGIYNEIGDYQQSIDFYKNALRLTNDIAISNSEIINIYSGIGYAYQNLKEYPSSLKYLQKGFRLSKSKQTAITDIAILTSLYNNLAICYQDNQQYDSTFYFLKKGLALDDLPPLEIATFYKHLGTTYHQQKNYQKAGDFLKKALALRLQNLPNKHWIIALTYRAIGDLSVSQKKYADALANYQNAIKALVLDFEEEDFLKNPKLENVIHKVELLKTLAAKAHVFQLQNKHQEAVKVYKICSQLMTILRSSFLEEKSKLFLIEEGVSIYEKAINAALTIEDKDAAFEFAETSKATLLLEAMRGFEARFGVPSDLLKKEQQLKIAIAYYEKQIWNAKREKQLNTDKIEEWEHKIFGLKQSYQQLLEKFAQNYTNYYQFQHNTRVETISTLQKKLLNNKKAIISYFVGSENIYVFTISKKKFHVNTFEKTAIFDNSINALKRFLKKEENLPNPHLVYYENASKIYTSYLKPPIQNLPKSIKELIIIPDGQLNFIPFEVLLTSTPSFSTPRYEILKMPYLINDFQITYGYSATLLVETHQRRTQSYYTTFGGFAPSFTGKNANKRGCDDAILGDLPFGRKNIVAINKIMNGQLYFDTLATVQNFKNIANQYKILHLCTHACATDDLKDSRIYFTDQELPAFELYNLPLQAQLAVLGACETGIGELKKGEGIMSLARAFMYSGCPSVVTSLWSVDDVSTSELMLYFYQNLKKGLPQDEALHNAKLVYLQAKGIEASHPYYWAGFVHIGNTEILFPSWWLQNRWWIFGIILLILTGFLYWKAKK